MKYIVFVILLFFMIECQNESAMIKRGNEIVSKIECYRNLRSQVPDSLQQIGIKIIDEDNPPFQYEKKGEDNYILYFSNGVGESKIYYSDTRQWEDFIRKIEEGNNIILRPVRLDMLSRRIKYKHLQCA